MPRPMTQPEREAFLAEPRVAVLSVARSGGRPPLSAPSFYAYEAGGDLSFFTVRRPHGAQVEFIERTGRVTAVTPPDPRTLLHVEVSVVRADRPPSSSISWRSQLYMPEEPPRAFGVGARGPESTIVVYTCGPTAAAMDFSDQVATDRG